MSKQIDRAPKNSAEVPIWMAWITNCLKGVISVVYFVADKAKFGNVTDGDYAEFESDGTLVFNGDATVFDDMLFEIKPQEQKIHASSGSVGGLVGTSTGTYLNTFKRDGIFWALSENSGDSDDYFIDTAAPLIFDDIEQIPVMFWSGYYGGSSAHAATMSWRVYNNNTTSWDALTYTFVEDVQEYDAIVTGFTADHINASNQVKVVLVHTSSGQSGHVMYIDEVYLKQDNTPEDTFFRGSFIEAFRNTGYDSAHGKVQFNHKYKPDSAFYWHVHFTPLTNIADGETVIFSLGKSFASIYNIFPPADSITATFTNNSAWRASLSTAQASSILSGTSVLAGSHILAAYGSSISGTGLNISCIGLFELKRDAGTYTGNAGVLYSDFHIEANTIGSREQFTK